MDTENTKGLELWIPQSLLLSKICGIDISQTPQASPNNPDSKNPFNLLFFNSQNLNDPILSSPIRTLLKNCPNFGTHNNSVLSSIESEEVEKFRESFLALLNQGRGTGISDKIVFLNVAFLHFCGKIRRGCMSKGEMQQIATVYTGIFGSREEEEAIFKSLDREGIGMISLLDFVCGFIASSPEVNDSPKTYEGKLRLQHIFTAYDIDKDGQLDKTELKLLISDIYKHGKFENSQQSIMQDVETLSSRFDTFTYDVFYKCVEIGAIQHTEILFRIAFDLAEKVKEHLVFALANIQILSTANPTREPLWSKGVEKMSANAFSPYNNDNSISGFKYTGIPGVNVPVNGVYGFQSGIFSDRSGLSSERSEGVDIYSQINSIYSPPQSDCRNFPYQLTQFKQFKPIEPYVYNNFTIQPKKEPPIKQVEVEQKDETKIVLELENRIAALIKDYFKRYIGHHSEDIVDQKVATSVFTQMYTTFFGLEFQKIESQITPFRWCNYHNLLMLCNNFSHIISKEEQIVNIKSPVHIIGDLDTNFTDLIRMFNMYGWPLHSRSSEDCTRLTHVIINICGRINPKKTPCYPLEFMLLVMALKVLFPRHITIIGHYEKSTSSIDTYNCHLYKEILNKLNSDINNFNLMSDKALISQCAKELLIKIINIFDVMPKGALVDQSVLIKGIPTDCNGIFDKYSAKKYVPRLTIIPNHSEESTNLRSLHDNLTNISDDPDCNTSIINNGSKYGLEYASLFLSGDKIIYNPLNTL